MVRPMAKMQSPRPGGTGSHTGDAHAAPECLTADLLIVGGGMVGACMALAAAKGGLTSILVDRLPLDDQQDPGFDGRSSAIARGSQQVLEGIGLWPYLAADAEAITDIRVSDGRPGASVAEAWASPFFLHYESSALDGMPLGYILENRALRQGMAPLLQARPEVTLCAPARILDLDRQGASVAARLDDGRELRAALVVAADGRFSKLRADAEIAIQSWGLSPGGRCLQRRPRIAPWRRRPRAFSALRSLRPFAHDRWTSCGGRASGPPLFAGLDRRPRGGASGDGTRRRSLRR